MKRSHLFALILALAAGGWILSGQLGHGDNLPEQQKPPAEINGEQRVASVRVRVSEAAPRAVELVARGQTAAVRKVEMRSETYGRIVELPVEKGSVVEEGALIAKLSGEGRPAVLAGARALLAQRRIEYDAAAKLSQKGFRSDTELAAAQARLEEAQAGVEAAQVALDNTVVRAPFRAFVNERLIELGDFVEQGDVLARIYDLDPLLVVAQVHEGEIGRLELGAAGSATLSTGETASGRLRFISRAADPATRTFRIELEVPNPDYRLADGVTAQLVLPVGEVMAHRLSPAILTLSDSGILGVKTVDESSRIAFVPVTIVDEASDGIYVTGLPPKATLVTVGQEFVVEGQSVVPVMEGGDALQPPTAATAS